MKQTFIGIIGVAGLAALGWGLMMYVGTHVSGASNPVADAQNRRGVELIVGGAVALIAAIVAEIW